MTKKIFVAIALMIMPIAAWADGFKDLDAALSAISRGFERGDAQAIVEGVGDNDQVILQFPGLVDKSGPFGRDQASYLLDELFQKAQPVRFEQVGTRSDRAENQYHITASWTIKRGDRNEERDLYITLRNRGGKYSIVSIKSGGR